jgi:hypothetical protein
MTMWTSADAINAEIEYRRESIQRTRSAVRSRRAARKERAAAARRKARRVEQTPAERTAHQRHDPMLPAQRTSSSSPATKQPV